MTQRQTDRQTSTVTLAETETDTDNDSAETKAKGKVQYLTGVCSLTSVMEILRSLVTLIRSPVSMSLARTDSVYSSTVSKSSGLDTDISHVFLSMVNFSSSSPPGRIISDGNDKKYWCCPDLFFGMMC